jgi:hypothetical protein
MCAWVALRMSATRFRNRQCCLREQQAICSTLQLRRRLDRLLSLLLGAQGWPDFLSVALGGGQRGVLRFSLGAAWPSVACVLPV